MKESLPTIKGLSHLTRRGCGKQLVVCVLITSWRFSMFVSNVPCLHLSIFVTSTCKNVSLIVNSNPNPSCQKEQFVAALEQQNFSNVHYRYSDNLSQQLMKKTIILPHCVLNVCFLRTFIQKPEFHE